MLTISACKNVSSFSEENSNTSSENNHFDIPKTYYIEYKSSVNIKEMESTSSISQWVDNANNKIAVLTESETNVMGTKEKSKSLMISKDDWNYIVDLNTNTGFKTKNNEMLNSSLNEIHVDNTLSFKAMIEKDGGKLLENEKFLNKDCQVIEITKKTPNGMQAKSKIWYYHGIPLKISNEFYTMEATKFEENASIPYYKFDIPQDIVINELPNY
jgi:hypothetical protein